MSKKKQKKKDKKKSTIISMVDSSLNSKKDTIIKEIEDLQNSLSQVDIALYKKGKKKNNPKWTKAVEEKKRAIRVEIVKKMEGSNLLDRIISIITSVAPIVVLVARLIAALILSILSIPSVKVMIKPKTLKTLNMVYDKAMKITDTSLSM